VITFAMPEAFLLVPLAALVCKRRLWPRPFVGVLRVMMLLLATALLAQPYLPGEADGRDIVLVLDRSRSMPAQGIAQAQELAAQIADHLRAGDRLGVVGFGRKPAIELVPQAPFQWPGTARTIDADGSDVAAAVDAGLSLVPPGRHGSLLVVSDGEHTGGDLEGAARAARRAGIRIDTQLVPRAVGADVAVADVQAPSACAIGEPFAVAAVVFAGTAGTAHWRLLADGAVLREGDAVLQSGRNVLQFRRALLEPGLHELVVEVSRAGDVVQQNDRGLAVVRAVSSPRILCVTPKGRDDRLTRSLQALGLDVVVAAPQTAPLSLSELDAVRCVVLEDVAAGDLPQVGMRHLATWVRDLGGGLLMTGGKASFGVGGYHRSPVEEVLPVTMEMREQQRRFGLAMAIALDRSGSMQVSVGSETKMQLADRGAAAAIELLSPIDGVAVIAIDSGPHVVVPMQPVSDKAALTAKVRQIESMGGGIYIGEALHAAARQLAASNQQNRHVLLFADAADSEEPADYKTFVPDLVKAGVTVSVIGLGSASDSDSKLLEEIAKLGQGRCQFVADATELPRVFAQETIQVARSSMVEEPAAVLVLPALRTLGDMPDAFPQVGGYSMAWRRPRAELALQTADDEKAALLAHWQVGLGRAAAFLGEADGPVSGGLADWDGYGDFFGTLARWLCGGQTPGLFVEARREGSVGVISLEVEAQLAASLDTARGVLTTPDGRSLDLLLERVGPGRLVARVPLERDGVYRSAIAVAGTTLRVPPLCLPYSPEWAVQPDARAGERVLRRLALSTGGSVQPTVDAVLAGPRRSLGRIDLGPWCAAFAVFVLLLEILVRRLQIVLPAFALPNLRWRKVAESKVAAESRPSEPPVASAEPGKTEPEVAPASSAGPPPVSSAGTTPAEGGVLGALTRAKERSKRQ